MLGIALSLSTPTVSGTIGEAEATDSLSTIQSIGEVKAIYVPSASALFQDSAGVTPVTTSGESVGLMLDQSLNGSNDAYQETATKRPTYYSEDGVEYLLSDGVDDLMNIDSRFGFEANPDINVFAALNIQSEAMVQEVVVEVGGTNNGNLTASVGSGGFSWRFRNGNAIFEQTPSETDCIARWSRDQSSAYGDSKFYLDSVEQSVVSSNGATTSPTIAVTTATLLGGANNNNISNIKLYGLIITGAVTDSEVTTIETYLSSLIPEAAE